MKKISSLPTDPLQSAKVAGLRYVSGSGPGIIRKRKGKGFTYIGVDGKVVRDHEVLRRIKSLAIPPAWTSVWISPLANGHLQAWGRDAKGRKQYRYHPQYREIRDETKYSRMAAFAAALPAIREKVEKDLALPGLPCEKVLATVVRLLETTYIRVGNIEYAKENDSFGLTTMRDRHVEVSGSKVRFEFKGKSGQYQEVELSDRRLARIIKQCQDLPGYELFQYLDDDGTRCTVDSADVNEYLREITGQDFTAKDFRTWAGTVLATLELTECDPSRSESECKKRVVAAIKRVAHRLGNRPATCRKYYVHPAVLEAYTSGSLANSIAAGVVSKGLSPEEACVMKVLDQHLKTTEQRLAS